MPFKHFVNKYCYSLAAVLTLAILITCRKIDYNERTSVDDVDPLEVFFSDTTSADFRVRAIARKIEMQNLQHDFIKDLVKRVGFPIWKKSLIVPPPQQTRLSNDSAITYLYIPFANDSTVNASLIVRTTIVDTSFRLLNSFEYETFGFDSTSNTWNAKNIFHLFAIFEKEIYGHTVFKILDRRLFPLPDTNKTIIAHFKNQNLSWERQNLLSEVTNCQWIDVCYGPDWYEDWCDGGCTTDCEYFTHSELSCTTVWTNGNGSPPGNSGGGSTWWPPVCGVGGVNCNAQGWTTFNTNDFQANYIAQGYRHFETWEMSSVDLTRINNWRINNIDTIGLDSCVRKILDKLIGGDNLIGRILAKIDNARPHRTDIEKYRITFLVDSVGSGNTAEAGGGTLYPSSGYFVDTIRINPALLKRASELAIAQSILHEIIHSYLAAIFTRYSYGGYTVSQIKSMSIDSLFTEYVDTLISYHSSLALQDWQNNNPQFDHNFMADKLLERMASALAHVDNFRNSQEYYWEMTWAGLHRTKTWQFYHSNYPNWPPDNPAPNNDSTWGLKYAFTTARIDSILTHLYNEQTDTAKAKGRHRITGDCFGPNGLLPD